MRLGMFMHPIHDFRRGYDTLLHEDLDVIRAADAEGFDEVWLGEHYLLPSEPFASPLMLYARLIAECPRITFGSGRDLPAQQAPRDRRRRGGAVRPSRQGSLHARHRSGAAPPDFELFEVLDKNRMEMLEESVDMMIRLWTEDPPYDIRGKYWKAVVKDNVLADIGVGKMAVPYQRPHPPIMLPSMSRNSASSRLAARRGWHMISANFVPQDVLAGHWRDYCDERGKLGLPIEPAKWRAGRTLLVTETDEEAQAYLRIAGQQPGMVFPLHHQADGTWRLRPHAEIAPRHAGRRGDAALLHRQHRDRRQPADGGGESSRNSARRSGRSRP